MTVAHLNPTAKTNGVRPHKHGEQAERPHPQVSFAQTAIEPSSFFGKLRSLYVEVVLKTQLEQMRKQGSYDAFKMQWHPSYDVRRYKGGMTRADGIPPSLFWESDVGKWIEGACYFLSSPDGRSSLHAAEFERCIQELVDMIEKAQQPDGYLNIYFTVVDPAGRYRNLRDLHEMYNAGHLLEASLAHYHLTGSRQFLDVMIKSIECFARTFGPESEQLHGYPGHPELELAVLRLYEVTKEPSHLEFGRYLLSARGVERPEQDGKSYFVWEARKRGDEVLPHTLDSLTDMAYNQSHAPLHKQDAILGHSVRALYLTTAAADLGDEFLEDAKRLLADAIDHKMYPTGGLGTEPRIEGFSAIPYRLPQSTDEGGCYAETCASIAAMMTSERILSHGLDGKIRDAMELCLLNAVLGGGSLDGKAFAYANKHATSGAETAVRNDWFEVCCCPPNLSRTLGMIGGYTWSAKVNEAKRVIYLDVYLFISATRKIPLSGGGEATVKMETDMPWDGKATWVFDAPDGWKWDVRVPSPAYATDVQLSVHGQESVSGFLSFGAPSSASVKLSFSLPVRLLSSNPMTGQDTITVTRGPITYVAESVDNAALEAEYPHFKGVGLLEIAQFELSKLNIVGFDVVALRTKNVYAVEQVHEKTAYFPLNEAERARKWKALEEHLVFIPWFARANRGGAGHVRIGMLRAEGK